MIENELISFHVDSIAQYKVLKHIFVEFLPEGIAHLELIENGLRLTDITGDSADFIYNGTSVVIKDGEDT